MSIVPRILALALFASSTLPVMANPLEEWKFEELNVAMAHAKQEGQPLFLLFGFKACPWCEYLYRRGMNDAETRTLYQESVALAYYDTRAHQSQDLVSLPRGTQLSHKQFIERFSAYPTPSWIFMSPSGVILSTNRNGKTTSRELRNELQQVLATITRK